MSARIDGPVGPRNSRTLSYNKNNNIIHYQLHTTAMKLVADRPTEQQTDIATYRAAIAAKKDRNDSSSLLAGD